ncbi:MAG: 2-C-methyl-D-erythritol 2,4-cyclodiphosphate synthase [Acidobacteriaceae bacterium]|jgi:2-C-methyl-D-erythritol 2,4-cyclodiphosphate synthase|nr:2-C-methyl-D-erythritol 2,4-cyclodiphosphate synthase [Acidobacteriaceae bacterium]MDX6464219.1 2-C-methyl-D-erythritol 2,4-cyclodiphosphate synthase [Acidobacteriaceae bacterium]MEA2257883.1 2-C-methyl-D-erythritol 2,4-cyclodiphosphate synthase [Acidobacteriaceae bacterium]MEA3008231.1 2-C-methyl-D-erythritol 2,4-cyclodiphosphate synthase [Acidobacteriaceae bacterium]
MSMRIGCGWDSHAFQPGVPLKIGGIAIDHPEGLAGHSDGDVLLHAITDALLGALAVGDIGSFFPPGDPRWKDADSAIFLNLALEEVRTAGYRIVNVDTTLVLAAPKIGPISGDMRQRVAELLEIQPNAVGIKAKTPEGLNLDHVAQAQAVVLLESADDSVGIGLLEAEVDDPAKVDEVLTHIGVSEGLGTSKSRRMVPLPAFDTEDIT